MQGGGPTIIVTKSSNKLNQVKYLSRLGGANLQKVVHGILKKVFSQEISEKINYTGRNGKLAYEAMKLRKIILGKSGSKINLFHEVLPYYPFCRCSSTN